MFNKAWINLGILMILIALIFDVNALLVLAAFLLTIVPVAWWWNQHSLDAVGYRRTFGVRRAFPGEVVDLTLSLQNDKWLPLGWLQLDDQWPVALPLEDGELFPSPTGTMGSFRAAFALRWFERISRSYQVRCTQRGFYPFGPARFRSGDLFGLFRQRNTQDHLDWLIVYPQVLPLQELGFPVKEPFGETRAAWRIFEDPSRAVGIRDHHPEDSFRHVHWKATARRQALQVKVYEPTTSHNLVIFLNVATFARIWQGINPLLLERAIAVTASIASYAVENRYVLGMLANGSIPHSDQPIKVLPSRRPDQLARVLEALAAVTSFATSSIESLLLAESRWLPWGATLIVVTAVVTDELKATLSRLRDVGRRLVLVSLEEGPEPDLSASLPGVLAYSLPASDLPFDESLMGQPGEWAPEIAPPLHFVRGSA
jgi:uncharacterized protein (DUF58 family)